MFAVNTRAATNPVVACATTTLYANVTDPIKLAFAPDGTLYVGRDNVGSGGNPGDAVKIHRVAPGGSPVTEYGSVAIADPDAVGFDALGIVSGTPGAVLVGSSAPGLGATISKINTNGVVTTLFGGVQANMNNPGELLFDATGRLYLSDTGSNRVFATSSAAAPINLLTKTAAYAMALDVSNRLAVGSFTTFSLSYYSTNGTFLLAGLIIKPGAPVVAGRGDAFWGRELYSINASDQLIRIDSFGNTVVVGTGFDGFLSMAFGPDNALYVSYRDYDVILRIAPMATPAPDHWWRADGNANDAVNTAHGTVSGGVTYVAGRFGQAFRFDGIDSEVSFGTTAGNFGTGDFTVACWVNTTNLGVLYVLSKRPACGHQSFWSASMNNGGSTMEVDQDAAGNNYLVVTQTNTVADNQWHHVAFVRRGANVYCYRDAVLSASGTTNGVAQISNAALLKAGNSPCVGLLGTVRYSGLLDDIKLYGCALSAAQIAESAGLPDPTRPTLNIAALPAAVRLSWATNATGYLLETNGALTFPAGWGVLTSNYNVLTTDYVVTNAAGGAARFYRLHKP